MTERLAEPAVIAGHGRLDDAGAIAVGAAADVERRVTRVQAEGTDVDATSRIGHTLSGANVPCDDLSHEGAQLLFSHSATST
jgi:hypothetical protein